MQMEMIQFILEILQVLFLVAVLAGVSACLFYYTKNPQRKLLVILALVIVIIYMAVVIFVLPGKRWCGGCQEWH